MSTYKGTLIAELLDVAINKTDEYSIEQIVEILTAEAEPLPQCSVCERPAGLVQCKNCNERFCVNGCANDHSCGGGSEPQRIRY